MDVSNREAPGKPGRRTRVIVAVALAAAVAIVVFVATGAWSDFRQGFDEGVHAAPSGPTTTR